MGLPADNAEGYGTARRSRSPQRLKGNLLLVHGTGDDNCHYQGAETLIDEFIATTSHSRMMAYPNRTHSISEGANTTLALARVDDVLPARETSGWRAVKPNARRPPQPSSRAGRHQQKESVEEQDCDRDQRVVETDCDSGRPAGVTSIRCDSFKIHIWGQAGPWRSARR